MRVVDSQVLWLPDKDYLVGISLQGKQRVYIFLPQLPTNRLAKENQGPSLATILAVQPIRSSLHHN